MTQAGSIATNAAMPSHWRHKHALAEFGTAGWLEKARQQPDKVRIVLDKVRTDELAMTIEVVRGQLDHTVKSLNQDRAVPIPLEEIIEASRVSIELQNALGA